MTAFHTTTNRQQGDQVSRTENTATPQPCRTTPLMMRRGLLGIGGIGAPSIGGKFSPGQRRTALLLSTVAALMLLSWCSAPAGAEVVHPFKESFGSAAQPGFGSPEGLAVDVSNGNVLVIDAGAGTVSRWSADGTPADFPALGTNVIDGREGSGGKPCVEEPESCDQTPEDGLSFGSPAEVQIAVDSSEGPTEGDIYVTQGSSHLVDIFGPDGGYLGQLTAAGSEPFGESCGVAVGEDGTVYVGDYGGFVHEFVPTGSPVENTDNTANLEAPSTCPVSSGSGPSTGSVFATAYNGPVTKLNASTGAVEYTVAEGSNTTTAVNPSNGDVLVASGQKISEYDVSGTSASLDSTISVESTVTGIAASAAGEIFVAREGASELEVFGPAVTLPITEDATAVGLDGATLNGTVFPEENQLSACRFEYGLETASGFEAEGECEPGAAEIRPDNSPHAVSLSLEGLQPNADYKFRLTATSPAGTFSGKTLSFSTAGAPRLSEFLAVAGQRDATVEATIDPRGFDTTYRIESGPSLSYGTVTSGTIAGNEGPTRISAHLDGLSPATTYHYRVVASSTAGGETVGPDQQVETLNSCGFTDRRCIELVSPAEKGPLASPGKTVLVGGQIQFQAAAGGSAIAYTVESGYPDTTAGVASALYLSSRGANGWSSQQLQPPTLTPPVGVSSQTSSFKVLSASLGCGVVSSAASLTPGAPAAIVEAGGENLYRRDDATGSYQLITTLPPVGPPTRGEVEVSGYPYRVVGMSPDCRRVIFRSPFRYPGIPTASSTGYQLYEWDGTALHNVALIPGPGGTAEPVPAEALPGAMGRYPAFPVGGESPTDYWRSSSVDGTRSIFTSFSLFGGDSGRQAIFLRDAGYPAVAAGTAPATDISQSETATANDGSSRFWLASGDGQRVFFTARYGLATNGSSSGSVSCSNTPSGGAEPGDGQGCDLYEYDAAGPAGARLTDLSPDVEDPKGAGVVGVLDASEDGSYVYFAARGRLAGGGSRTEAQNLEAGTYNIFVAHAGEVRFVGLIGQSEAIGGSALVDTYDTDTWTSRSSRAGTDFAYESSLGAAAGSPMVYLYSTASGTEVCVSCRRDGLPPFSENELTPLIDAQATNTANRIFQPTILTENGRLYFYSFDPLAPGAVEGDRNLFQWEHGQVSLIATEPPGVPRSAGRPIESFFGGASADGGDVFFATPKGLVDADRDERWDVYDARVDGGLPEPTPAPTPCDAGSEGACNGAAANPPAAAAPATSNFNGPGNPPATNQKKKRHHKKHHHHKKKHHKKKHAKKKRGHKKNHHKKAGNSRRAHDNRRAGK